MKQIFYASAIIILWFAACRVDDGAMVGKWQATHFYENQQSVNVPLEEVKLVFEPNHRYFFQTIGQYSEGGRWRCSGKYLILSDTTEANPSEKMLKVLYQSNDSLKIKMSREGKEQVLFFARTQ
jgi:hypothetical protein